MWRLQLLQMEVKLFRGRGVAIKMQTLIVTLNLNPPEVPLTLALFPCSSLPLAVLLAFCLAVGVNSSRPFSQEVSSSSYSTLSSIFPGGQASFSSSSSPATSPCVPDFFGGYTHLVCGKSPSGEFCFPRMLISPEGVSFPHSGMWDLFFCF